MAGYFKKKRGSSGPSKNEQKLMRARRAEDEARSAGTLRDKFPAVARLKIRLTFLDHQRLLEERDLALSPSDSAVFSVACPGRCGVGSFDFGKKIAETAAARRPFSESSAQCSQPLYGGSAEACGLEIRCRMDVEYLPAQESAA